MSILGLFSGTSTLLVGVEDDPEGGVRCYLGHRANGMYCIVEDPDAVKRVRDAWAGGGHIAFATPPSNCIYSDEDPALSSPRTDLPTEETR